MLCWRTLPQNAKGCHYRTTFPMTKEQRQRSTEEKNTLRDPGRKEVPNEMFHEMNMKNTAQQNVCKAKRSLKEKLCLVIILQSLTFIANTARQRLSSSDLTSTRSQRGAWCEVL